MSSNAQPIIDIFAAISAIPRCSRNEAAIAQWMRQWADQRKLPVVSDDAGNLVIQVPASPGAADASAVVIQGHLDMVCEKHPSSDHDFSADPIQVVVEGDWLTAKGTSLGADNGIALAYALALVDHYDGPRPPLELLFTVDEETGLNGAKALDPSMITGRRMLNIDSEQAGEFTIGCAGGVNLTLSRLFTRTPLAADCRLVRIGVAGGRGGHSGIDIDKHRGNANNILARALTAVLSITEARITALSGGTAHNAIPREAEVIVAISPTATEAVVAAIDALAAAVASEYRLPDPALTLRIESLNASPPEDALTLTDTAQLTATLMALPTGPMAFSVDADRVATSLNIATVVLGASKWEVLASLRSDGSSSLTALEQQIRSIARLAGTDIANADYYPPWPPDDESALLSLCQQVHHTLFGTAPNVVALHAGLECAVIGDLVPGMDMISFGPTIQNPHSPDERMLIPAVESVWEFIKALMAKMAEDR